jgi:hypothetical protein
MEGERARADSPAVISAKLRCDWEDWLPVATADATCVLLPVRRAWLAGVGGGGHQTGSRPAIICIVCTYRTTGVGSHLAQRVKTIGL